jgi:hypothetical protein
MEAPPTAAFRWMVVPMGVSMEALQTEAFRTVASRRMPVLGPW